MQPTRVLFESATPQALALGLRSGQERSHPVVSRCGWYNLAGEMLGWGDLDEEDVIRIMSDCKDENVFLILYNAETFWRRDQDGLTWSDATQVEIAKPGSKYVINNASVVITVEGLFFVDSFDDPAWASLRNFGPVPSMHKEQLLGRL